MVRPVEPRKDLSRVAVVAGLRTPFVKMGTAFKSMSALDLARVVVRELLERSELSPKELDAVVYGQVVPSLSGPNIARELVLGLELPRTVDAFSVSRACATSTQAIATATMMIQTGQAKVVVCGGADSASDVPITVSKHLAEALIEANGAKTPVDKVKAFSHLSAKDLLPVPPALKELSTELTMGESAEKMAKENGITREAQDAFAHRSHTRAANAWSTGVFADEVMTVQVPPAYDAVSEDNIVRKDSTLEGYAKLRPAFDRRWGTITAGNSSALTDGASAVLLMRADVARALGHKPLGLIRSFAFAALDPWDQMLMGPAYAAPRALDAGGLTMAELSLVDLHEAFAAQVLSNLQAFGSKKFANEKLDRREPIGEVDDAKLNVHGGSISLGHPFAATGARQLVTVLRELGRRGGGYGLVAQCAAGGLGAALTVEV
ncbi:acetyl-CoA C-acyltransferase FadI [Myxococcota bacterium]|nr:acetyl-CoA C-acyltransferase FadI [Myxococcota bacterium]